MRYNWGSLLFVFLSILLQLTALGQDVGLARHKRIFAVPAPGPVTIDGKFDDWDLSGQIWMYVTMQTAEMQGAKFAMMYDADALYLSAVVRDSSPLMNRHDPLVNPEMAWDADVCQVRFMLDPKAPYPYLNSGAGPNDQLITMNLWYYTDRKEPCLQIGSGMSLVSPTPRPQWPKGVATHDAYQAAYTLTADKLGYTLEYRIPWSTLGANTTPKAGDILASNVQFNWSSPDGLHTAGGSAWAYDVMNGSGFAFQSSACWGKAIFSDKGNLPKEIVEEGTPPVAPQPLTFSYTLPKDGDVTVALVNAQGKMVRHVVVQASRKAGPVIERWNGMDDLGKPLPAGEYTWKGIYHDPIKTKYLLSVHNSGHPPFITPDGTGAWGSDHTDPSTVCAVNDRMLLAWAGGGEAGWALLRTDLTGRRQWGIRQGGNDVASDGELIYVNDGQTIAAYAFADGRPMNFERGESYAELPPAAIKSASPVTGLAYANGILYAAYSQLNSVVLYNAKQGTVKESWPVPAPARLAVSADGKTLVTISQRTVIRLSATGATPLISTHLDNPVSIALDATGNIYVANRGKLQNVSVFSPDGQYRFSIGKAGGRPAIGRYERLGMLEPGGIAVDKDGKLWVAETLDSPKRVSVWDTKTGKPLNEFFGGSEYATFVSMNPKHEDEVICHNVLWKVDLNKGTWMPKSTIWRATVPNAAPAPHGTAGCGGPLRVFTAKNGREYAWARTSNYTNALYMRQGDVFIPLVCAVWVLKDNQFVAWPPYPLFADNKIYPNGSYVWQDANNDQVMQAGEIISLNTERAGNFMTWVDDDLNICCTTGELYRPISIKKDGRPVYDFRKAEKLPVQGFDVIDPQDGNYYAYGMNRWTRDGKLLWNYPVTGEWHATLNKPIAKPGEVWGPTSPLGIAGDFTGVATYFGPFNIFTRDGLFVAKLFNDGRLGITGPESINAEAFSGQMVKLEKSGRYLFLGGDQDGRVTELLGLDTVKPFNGTYTISPDDARAAKEAQDAYAQLQARAQPLTIVRGAGALSVAQGIHKEVDPTRSFSARMAYDADNLYVAYDVTSPNELTNSAPDWRTIFKGGNCLDVQFAADPKADPARKTPVPGDTRILVTRQGDKTVAVVYRPKVKDFTGQPIVFTTVNKESIDSIEQTTEVKLDYRKTATGFAATVAIPLSLLGWTPVHGSTVKADVGYIFGNATGNQVAVRSYWSNNSFSANVTGDVPTESRLEPDQWGTAVVE